MSEWAVWPIFLLQAMALGLLFLPRDTYVRSVRLKAIVMVILFIVCLMIVVSLYHDSTDVLNLYF